MEIRKLRIWDGKAKDAADNCGHASEYKGFYIDDDKNNAEDMGTITWPVRRLGFVFDTKKACIVCFMQYVTSFNDPRPTDLVIDPKKDIMVKLRKDEKETKWLDSLVTFKVLAAWSTDPLKADPPRQQVPCQVSAFCKRDMNENEKLIFANIPRELPALAGRQRYSDEQATKNWEAKVDEIITRVAEKFSVSLASGITQAISTKPEAAPVKADEAPSDMLTIYESAKYARVDVRTIGNWLKATTGNGPMLPGVLRSKRKIRIPRAALDPWKQTSKRLRKSTKSIKKRGRRKTVKR